MKLRTKILIFPVVFVVILGVLGLLTVGDVKDKVIRTAQEKLKGDLAMAEALLNQKLPGDWVLRDGKLFKGNVQMNDNFSLVDTVGELTSDTVTVFQGDTRIATNVKDASGKRAVGTRAADNVVEAVLKKGEVYIGKAMVVGVWNQTTYKPIKSASGQVIGMFYVGVPNTKYDEAIKDISTKIILFSLIGLLIVAILGFYLLRSITVPVNRVVKGLTEGAKEVASGSTRVSAASQSLAQGASEQAAELEETSSSIEEMASMTRQNAENARQANTLMADTAKVVEEANYSMTQLTESMKEISTASEETAKIIKTIDEIAFQTNLLALNAAVEAARAGEAGAGFAVVADEVRNLAMRAADAAKNTADLIEGTVKKIKNGSDIVARSNEAFAKVATGAKKVGDLVGEISAASNEQAQGVDQINKAVSSMNEVVQRNAASAEESASAAEEMNAQAEQMNGLLSQLVSMVDGGQNGNLAGWLEGSGHVRTNQRDVLVLKPRPGGRTQNPLGNNPVTKGKGNQTDAAALNAGKVKPNGIIRMEGTNFKEI